MSRSQFWFALFSVLPFVLFDVHGQDVGFGQHCSQSNNCRSDLMCLNGYCECLYPRHQYFDFATDRCVSLLLAPCTSVVDGGIVDIPCILNAECRNDTGFSECQCKPGTRPSGRFCRGEIGQPCTSNGDCFNPSFYYENALVCRNQRCDCLNLETFDEFSGRCVGLVGAFCGSSYICVEGASCDRFDSFDGTCRCTDGFVPTADRRCTLIQ